MKYKTILIGVLVAISLLVTNYVTNKDKKELKEDNNKATLAIMVEQNNGNYQVANSIPSGYDLNETLSGCENGGTVSYDGTKISMKANTTDICYLYFDIPE